MTDLNTPHGFFVYGTLRPGGSNYGRYLDGLVLSEVKAIAPNHRMYSQAIAWVFDWPGESVVGYYITVADVNFHMVLKDLDRLEGFVGPGGNNYYERKLRPVELSTGETVQAWIYHGPDKLLERFMGSEEYWVPGGDWFLHKSYIDPREVKPA